MRLWSIHPRYLDVKGLLALWREGLLAQKVLEGKTRGYTRHPQLERFRESGDPLGMIGQYLEAIKEESVLRGYHFDGSKILRRREKKKRIIRVARGQLAYEWALLKKKVSRRDRTKYRELRKILHPRPHPRFIKIEGGIASWERVRTVSGRRR